MWIRELWEGVEKEHIGRGGALACKTQTDLHRHGFGWGHTNPSVSSVVGGYRWVGLVIEVVGSGV